MFLVKAKIIYNKRIKGNFFHCKFIASEIAKAAKPGQFVDIRISDGYEPLLRRPFGVHKVKGKIFEILYEVVGNGTQTLSQKKAGECLDILGPLGNGFSIIRKIEKQENLKTILVAGGMGVAPLTLLAKELKKHKPVVLIGAKTKSHITCEAEFKKLGCDVKIATDDGSRGFKGYVSDLLEHLLSTIPAAGGFASGGDYRLSTIYACGPRQMLKEICRIAKEHGLPAQISLEEHMSCGVGACLGCVVKVRSQKVPACRQAGKVKTEFEYKRVCKEGPVFDAQGIIWE